MRWPRRLRARRISSNAMEKVSIRKPAWAMWKCGYRSNRKAWIRSEDEQSTSTGGHAQRRVRPDVGWKARKVGRQRPAFRGLGDLPREGIARGSEPALCVAVERLVRAGDPALERRRQDLGAGGQQVRLRRRSRHAPVVRRHAASVGVQARLASGAVADRSGHGLRRRGRRRACSAPPMAGKNWQELSGLRGHGSGPHWQPGAGGMCLHTILLDPSDPAAHVHRDLGRGRVSHRRWRQDLAADQQGPALAVHSRSDGRGGPLRSPHRHASARGRTCCSCRSIGT